MFLFVKSYRLGLLCECCLNSVSCYDPAMTILTYGINHKTAPISIREKWSFSNAQALEALHDIKQKSAMNEAVILSTCNRTEIYTLEDNATALNAWLKQRKIDRHNELQSYTYSYRGLEAIQHIMRVASGLDSMVLGEPQIFGQIKQAYQIACEAGTVGQHLQHLFPSIFSVSKTIRHNTGLSKNAVSLAYVIVQVARRIFSALDKCRILLVGSGEMIDLVATHFSKHQSHQMIIASRNIEKAQQLAEPHNALAIRIGDIPQYIKSVDIVVSATASQLPILGKGMVESALKIKKHRPMLMIDLAVPRDIESEVAELEDVYLYNIDDLQNLIQQNMKHRESAAKQAETMIALEADHYLKQLRVFNSGDIITQYRQQAEALRDEELQKALFELERGRMPEAVLRNFARNLTNKLIHHPTTQLRDASYHNDIESLLLAKKLLDL